MKRLTLVAACAAALTVAAGCGTAVNQLLTQESTRTEVMDRIAADSTMAGAMLDRLMQQGPMADRMMSKMTSDPALKDRMLGVIAQDRELVDQFMAKAMADENTKAYLMGMVRGMGTAKPPTP